MRHAPPLTTPPPDLEIRQDPSAGGWNIIGYSAVGAIWSPITCYDFRTLWTSQSAAWGCSESGISYIPATACSTDTLGREFMLFSGAGRSSEQCSTSQGSLHCFTGTIFEFPDFQGATRTGAACFSESLNGIVVYVDTRTGVAHATSTSTFSSRIPLAASSIAPFTTRNTGLLLASTATTSSIVSASPTNDQAGHNGLQISDKIALGIGLGLGIPSTIAAVVTMGLGLRKLRNRKEAARQR